MYNTHKIVHLFADKNWFSWEFYSNNQCSPYRYIVIINKYIYTSYCLL